MVMRCCQVLVSFGTISACMSFEFFFVITFFSTAVIRNTHIQLAVVSHADGFRCPFLKGVSVRNIFRVAPLSHRKTSSAPLTVHGLVQSSHVFRRDTVHVPDGPSSYSRASGFHKQRLWSIFECNGIISSLFLTTTPLSFK